MKDTHIIIDFDSTISKIEGLDALSKIALANKSQEAVNEIESLTNQGMDGAISFKESLEKRIALLSANKSHIEELLKVEFDNISESFLRNSDVIKKYTDNWYVVSSGFKEFIVPIALSLGFKEENVLANTFKFNESGDIIGYDTENPLASDGGKIKVVKALNLNGNVHVIGDGFTDYEIKKAGLATEFYAYTGNVKRQKVVDVADKVIGSFDEYLFINDLPRSQSYPKSRIKVLLLENVHPVAQEAFRNEGFDVEFHKGALDEEELLEKIPGVSIIGLRSKTNLTAKVLEKADKLIAIGAFCIGTNQIDLEVASQKGIAVFNAPYSNTRSVVELAIGEIIMLVRNIFPNSVKMHNGVWNKSAVNNFEIRGKKIGIIGYGHIGTQLSVISEALGMEVYFYDIVDKMPIGNAIKCRTMEEVLEVADYVTLHIDGRKENDNLIGKKEFDQMKDRVIFLNLARGKVVVIQDLVDAIKSGKVVGAGVDVFPEEPKTNKDLLQSELMGLDNVILSPHIGGSTEEAQVSIGNYVPERLLEFINNGSSTGSVNFPEVQLPLLSGSHRLLHIHKNIPGILAKINALFAKHNINITGQYLKTNESIGYVIMDISKTYTEAFLDEMKNIEGTIKFRRLY